MEVFALELEFEPIYFAPKSLCANGNSVWKERTDDIKLNQHVIFVTAFSCDLTFAENIWRNSKLKSLLESFSSKGRTIITTVSFNVDDSGEQISYEEGFALMSNSREDVEKIKQRLLTWKLKPDKEYDIYLFELYLEENKFFKLSFNSNKSKAIEVVQLQQPHCHPAYASRDTNSVYHNITRVNAVLDAFQNFDEVKELRKICDSYILEQEFTTPIHPVVVIEGLDGTGKTTLTESVAQKTNATMLKSPPECIMHLRKMFDSHCQLLRRAYYALGN
uniref:Thymidylate kinase-like domain-containing protein n=1 Tax=Ciona savignyi TaxID=51511 RepID=H2ZCH3_CIOSA